MVKLQVHLHSGANLIAKDSGGTSDPYVSFAFGTDKKKSKTLKKTLNPEWDEAFELQTSTLPETLELEVFDKDLIGKDDKLGRASIPLKDLGIKQKERKTVTLQDVASGTITLSLVAVDFGRNYEAEEKAAQAKRQYEEQQRKDAEAQKSREAAEAQKRKEAEAQKREAQAAEAEEGADRTRNYLVFAGLVTVVLSVAYGYFWRRN